MIEGKCHTTLDGYKQVEWPTQFVVVPREGDLVQSVDGSKILKVMRIIHAMAPGSQAFIKVELNKVVREI